MIDAKMKKVDMRRGRSARWAALSALALLAACQPQSEAPAAHDDGPPPAISNRIAIPPAVVSNLGITFAKVQRRHVAQTLRVPGAFESPPLALRAYAEAIGGRVTLLVAQYQRVSAGDELYRLDSPELARMSAELIDADALAARGERELEAARAEIEALDLALNSWPARIAAIHAQIKASEKHVLNLESAARLWAERVALLARLDEQAGGRAAELAEARARHAESLTAISSEHENHMVYDRDLAEQNAVFEQARARAPLLHAQLGAAAPDAAAARHRAGALRREIAAKLGVKPEQLDGERGYALAFTQRAAGPGLVTRMGASQGRIVEAGATILEVLDDSQLRFRARALQADLALLRDGLEASIVPPAGGSALAGKLALAPEADARARTFDLIVTPAAAAPWARPGVSAEAEIVYDATAEPRLAIPVACVLQDGLDKIFFRRDPNDAQKVIRTVANLGMSDGRWVVVLSDAMEGDQIVLHGAYELKLSGAGRPAQKGHFHADGTFHAEDH